MIFEKAMQAIASISTGCLVHGRRRPQCSPSPLCARLALNTTAHRRAPHEPLRRAFEVRASADGSGEGEEDPDARLESLERGRRRRSAPTQAKPKPASSSAPASRQAEWKEGKLFPEGWEEMSPLQKAAELYTGKRGVLFWATKVTYASLFIIGGAWILFRVVGPLTGLYKLENDLLSPPNL